MACCGERRRQTTHRYQGNRSDPRDPYRRNPLCDLRGVSGSGAVVYEQDARGLVMLLCHDPGHGAKPAILGVCKNGIVERDAVLSIVQDIAAGIPWVEHQLLRKSSIGLLDADRAQVARQLGAEFVLCHHINEDLDANSHGLITFYEPGDAIGQQVATVIAGAAPEKLLRPEKYRTYAAVAGDWTSRALWVLDHYRKVGIPCALIEWGFASYPTDAAYLLDTDNRPAMVACVAAGVARAMELINPGDNLVCQDAPKGNP